MNIENQSQFNIVFGIILSPVLLLVVAYVFEKHRQKKIKTHNGYVENENSNSYINTPYFSLGIPVGLHANDLSSSEASDVRLPNTDLLVSIRNDKRILGDRVECDIYAFSLTAPLQKENITSYLRLFYDSEELSLDEHVSVNEASLAGAPCLVVSEGFDNTYVFVKAPSNQNVCIGLSLNKTAISTLVADPDIFDIMNDYTVNETNSFFHTIVSKWKWN